MLFHTLISVVTTAAFYAFWWARAVVFGMAKSLTVSALGYESVRRGGIDFHSLAPKHFNFVDPFEVQLVDDYSLEFVYWLFSFGVVY